MLVSFFQVFCVTAVCEKSGSFYSLFWVLSNTQYCCCRCVSMAITGTSKLHYRLLKKTIDGNRAKLVQELNQTIFSYLWKNMSTVSGRTVANTIRSLVELNLKKDLIEKLLVAAVEELRKRPTAFSTQERCMMVGTFAAERHHPGVIINESVNRVCSLTAVSPYHTVSSA